MQTNIHFRYFGLLLITGILATSCSYINNRQNGSGNVIKQERKVSSFDKLDVSVVFNTVIIPANEEKVIVETDDNLQQYVIVETRNSTLSIHMASRVNIGKEAANTIYIYTKTLQSIENSSVGNLSNEGVLSSDNFTLTNQAVGNVELKIKAKKTTIDNSAVGTTNLFLQTDSLTLGNSAVGKILLTGSCTEADINNSSVGNFDSHYLTTQVLHINNSAVGKTEISAEKEFYIDNSAVGKLDMYGDGVIKRLNDSGISKASKH
jgi:hypothetical protein